MRTVAICQARMNSSRLPGKMLLPLAGAPLVQRVLERVQRATKLDTVVLAFPMRDLDAFLPICTRTGVEPYAFPGDENDLVARYLGAAQAYQADIIVRIPCDNPCVEPEYIDSAVGHWFSDLSPFITNTTAGSCGKWVDGIGAEVLSISRLKWLDEFCRGRDAKLREHVHLAFCPYLTIASLHLDVNTQADYEFIKGIYDTLYPVNPHFTIQDILEHLETHGRTTAV